MSERPAIIATGLSDADRALAIKQQVLETLAPLCRSMDDAVAAGFEIGFSVGRGPLGKYVVTALKISKEF